ncbi:MAG: sensor histidine kinase, partial [Pleurocapsa sp. SU_196_0]|nr:sensor histidine kinase [Pleurocapsa sp. SU_196_0]
MIFFTITAAFGNHVSYREIITANRLRRSQLEVERVARIAERERIARDLHDLLGHTLSVIVLKSELASRLADRDPPRAATEIRDVERIARESLQEVRSAVRGYRSAGLEAEFASVRLACEAAGLKLELYLVPVELEWASEQAFSYVLRESVTNTIRHANARTLWVSLERVGNNAQLSLWDDGSGRITENNGVRGMRERLEALGGTLQINATHKGIIATLPVRAAPSAFSEQKLEPPA